MLPPPAFTVRQQRAKASPAGRYIGDAAMLICPARGATDGGGDGGSAEVGGRPWLCCVVLDYVPLTQPLQRAANPHLSAANEVRRQQQVRRRQAHALFTGQGGGADGGGGGGGTGGSGVPEFLQRWRCLVRAGVAAVPGWLYVTPWALGYRGLSAVQKEVLVPWVEVKRLALVPSTQPLVCDTVELQSQARPRPRSPPPSTFPDTAPPHPLSLRACCLAERAAHLLQRL